MATWFVTGASSGIGRAVTEQVLDSGGNVAAVARRVDDLADLARLHDGRLWVAPLDVTDTAALRATVERAFAELGRIDVVFSNAGSAAFGAAEELDDVAIDQQIALNLVAPIQLTRAALPHLRAQGGGRIVQTSTMGAQITSPGGSMYHATKWGVEGFLESVAAEVAGFGVGITLVEPGNVRTEFGAAMSIAEPLDAYAETSVGQIRGVIETSDGNLTGGALGDPGRVAAAIIASTSQSPAPRRLVLGSDAHGAVRAALVDRLAEVEAGAELAVTTDFDHPDD